MITIERSYLPFGTYGEWTQDDPEFKCYTVERPWLENQRGVSCIPEGTYRIFKSRYHRGDYDCYEVEGVQGRSLIKIHIGNWPENFEGCIGLGKEITPLSKSGNPVLAVSSSGDTFKNWMAVMDGKDEDVLKIITKTC